LGLQDKVVLGNLSAKRDWSHAADVAEAMYRIITAPTPDDYVVASGEMHSVEEFAQLVFSKLELNYLDYIEFDASYLRPTEVDALCGDASKLRTNLGWRPQYNFQQLIDEMVDADMELAKKEKLLQDSSK
jgi:GDPmannose 4,6-dehydratase